MTCILQANVQENYICVENNSGPVLGYSPTSGVTIISKDGLKFKDLNKNGKLDVYGGWRLPSDVRAKDLAKRMTVEQIAATNSSTDPRH